MALNNVDLSTYIRIGRYDLPEPTRTNPPTNSLLAQEVSAVTYNWDSDTLFVVGDGGTSIVQVTKTGQLIDSVTLAPGTSPQGTDFYDTEGLTYVGGGKFVLIEERDRQANLFTYVPGSTLTKSDVKTVKLGTTVGNIGIEGISYDPQTNGFIAVKEITPEGIFQTTIDFAAGTASNGSPTTENSINLFDPALAGLADFADVYALSNLSSLSGKPDSSHLLILSQESGKIVNIDRAGNISSSLTIAADAGNPLSVADQQHEGLTMDNNGYLYVTSENGGGDINHPQLWVYAPSTAINQAPTAVVLNNKVNAVPENTSTTTRIKVADIAITDDGLGTNNLTVTGTDANFFEADSTGLYIKAGTTLDYETKTSYSVSVNVDDTTVGNTPDATTAFTLAVTDVVNETPTSTGGSIFITEVAPWSSGNSPVAADWFELTNKGSSAVNITGWKIDDNSNSFGSAVALNGITSIAPGESVIFIEGATVNANFLSNWFGTNPPAGLQIGNYSGSGVGLSTAGDAVNIYNASGVLQANVVFGASPSPTVLPTFDNAALLNNATISTVSVVGTNGAFFIVDSLGNKEIGSPGRINAPASISGNAAANVKEGTNVNPNGKLTIAGSLTVTDADTGQDKFATTVTSANGNLGSLTITDTGAFTYIVDNSAVQYLGAGQTKVDTFTVTSLDGTASKNIAITINGVTAGFSGVAAGDATSNEAILWTRTFDAANATIQPGITENVTVQLSTDSGFTNIVKSINGVTRDATHDYTLKIDATGLQSGTKYYYRFQTAAGELSSVGTFKTTPDANIQTAVRFAFSGDADGLMRPYSSTANFGSLNLDFFGFLGDTIYETASNGSPAATTNIVGNPTQALIDYHRKYLENIQPVSNGGFSSLKTLYSSQGNYTLLDNHELGNKELINGGAPTYLVANSTIASAANGSTNPADDVNTTGQFVNQTVGFKTLLQAYSDYQAIKEQTISAPNDPRTNGTQQLYGSHQWGENLLYVNTDTRSYRDVRLNKIDPITGKTVDDTGDRANNPNRTMLGATQLAWLKQTLLDAQKNGTVWKFVAVSDPIDQIGAIGSGADGGKSWIGGYRAERNDLLKFIADNHINNVVFLATDDHQNRINELTYLDDINDPSSVRVLPNALSIVDGPIGATGPDAITDHSFANIKSLADKLAATQTAAGVNPVGLDANYLGLKNVVREGDPNADTLRQPIDFYSPDTFNYTTFDISADGKTLNVNVQGINSSATNSFPEPSAANPVRSILSFSLDAAQPIFDFSAGNYSVTEGNTPGFSTNGTVRVTRRGDLSGTNSVQLQLSDGTATGGVVSPTFANPKGISSSATPYLLASGTGVSFTSILTVGDSVGGYKMAGIPDGLGTFDNGDGTFTLLMNQEIGNTSGVTRAHGNKGAFVSSWVINKSDLSVVSGSDLIQNVYTWNAATQSSNTTPNNAANANGIAFNRFCSADLPAVTAYFNPATGLGTQERIFMDGEEGGTTGYQLATIATGAHKGDTYILGKFNLTTNGSGLTGVGAWENALANPFAQDKTIVIGNNDGGTGIINNAIAVYVGTKTNTGSEIDKAGLTNGTLKFVNVTGSTAEITNSTTRATNITSGTAFTLSGTASTTFSRPEDGAWNPLNPSQYFFVTTDQLDTVTDGIGTQIGRSRLWRLNFTDITKPDAGGTIDLLLDGTEGGNMFDNITVDKYGHIILLEDVGNAAHNGKIWQYDIATDSLKQIAQHDPSRFGNINLPPTAPFTVDEESSGVIDAQDILGPGWFLIVNQSHYANPDPALVEGGQLLAFFNPDTFKASQSSLVDYNNKPITVTFAPGETFKDVQIPIVGDTNLESDETVNLSLANPSSGAVVGTKQPNAVLTIVNDDLNSAPVAVDDAVSTSEKALLKGNVLVANPKTPDSDPNNDPLTVSAVNGNADSVGQQIILASGALLTLNANGTFDYNPNGKFNALGVGAVATDSFNYTISDRNGGNSTATVTVTIKGVNDIATITGTATAAVIEDAATPNLTATGSLTVNDVDAGQNIFNTTVTPAIGNLGSLSITDAGAYSYSVANSAVQYLGAGKTKTDTFTVKSIDGTASKDIVVTINGVNDVAAITGTAIAAVIEDVATPNLTATGSLTVNDVDAGQNIFNTTVTSATGNLGSLSITDAGAYSYSVANSAVQYLGAGKTKTDTFTVKSIDGTASKDIIVTINGVNDAPVGVKDSATTGFNTAVKIQASTLLANDTDVDSTSLSITGVSGVTNGTAVLKNNGTANNTADDFILFTPSNGFSGNASFNYTLSDGSLTGTASVTVTVGANIEGTNKADYLVGTDGNDDIESGNGNDTIYGGAGDDDIDGGNGNDILYGGLGKDTLTGGNGDDILYGGLDKDTLTGGNGKDIFAFTAGEGTDTITDFTKGQDLIGLYGGLSFGQLSFSGKNILVTSTNEVLATLTGVNTTTLTAANFVTL